MYILDSLAEQAYACNSEELTILKDAEGTAGSKPHENKCNAGMKSGSCFCPAKFKKSTILKQNYLYKY